MLWNSGTASEVPRKWTATLTFQSILFDQSSSTKMIVSLPPFLLRTRSPQTMICRHNGHGPPIGTYWPHSRSSLAKQVKWQTKRHLEFRQDDFDDSSSLTASKQMSQIDEVRAHQLKGNESSGFGFERRTICPRHIFIWSGGGFVTCNSRDACWMRHKKVHEFVHAHRKLPFEFRVQPSNGQWQSIPRAASQHLRQYAKIVIEKTFAWLPTLQLGNMPQATWFFRLLPSPFKLEYVESLCMCDAQMQFDCTHPQRRYIVWETVNYH